MGIGLLSILFSLEQGENKRPYLDKGRVDRVHGVMPSNVSRKLYNYLKNAVKHVCTMDKDLLKNNKNMRLCTVIG